MIDAVSDEPAAGPAVSRSMRRVRGWIHMPQGEVPPEAATILVAVEDVSRADAPSIVLAEQRLEHVPLGGDVAFEVDVPGWLVEERARYTVRVHVDVTGTGIVERGDLVSTQSHPVLTGGNPDEASVPVKLV
jgi:putative lipoprotein